MYGTASRLSPAGLAALLFSIQIQAHTNLVFSRDYLEDVCKPAVKSPSDVIPPCTEIEVIEAACAPNGTGSLYLTAHQECMCGGSYFPEWLACLDCQYFHGLRSPRDFSFYQTVLSAASSSFCGAATPASQWQTVFASQEEVATQQSTGATSGSDQAPSQTAVSLYYTPAGPQGPGQITGSAASATATGTTTPSKSSVSITTTGSKSSGGSQTTSSSSSSTTTTSPNAAGMNKVGANGILMVGIVMGSKLLL